jgi:hypothetical protein
MATTSISQDLLLPQSDHAGGGLYDVSHNGEDVSYAQIVANGDGTYTETLYVYDVTSGTTTTIASVPAAFTGDFADDQTEGLYGGVLPANGQYVAYSVGNPDNGELFVKDVQSDAPAVGPSGGVLTIWSVSDDGREVSFDQDNSEGGSFVENVGTGGTSAFGNNSSDEGFVTPDGLFFYYSDISAPPTPVPTTIVNLIDNTSVTNNDGFGILSDDDQYYAYQVVGTVANTSEVYLRGPSGAVTLISATASGVAANGANEIAAISGDDRHVVFESTTTNLTPDHQGGVFVKDLDTGSITRVAEPPPGPADDSKIVVSSVGISDDGSRVTVASDTGIIVTQFLPSKLGIKQVTDDNIVNAAEASGNDVFASGTSGAIGSTVDVSVPAEPGETWTAVVQADGTWSTKIDVGQLQDGSFDIHATVTDDYNLVTTADSTFTVDRTPPQLDITSVAGDNFINAAELTHAIAAGTVVIGDPPGTAPLPGTLQIKIDNGPSTNFSQPANSTNDPQPFADAIDATGFADGAHTVTVTAIDEAGNTTVKTIGVIIDTTPPKIAITSVSGDDVVDSNEIKTPQGVEGTSDAIGQTVTVLLDGVKAGQAVVQADGTWISTVDFSGKATGNHDITAEVSDEAGNVGRADVDPYVDAGFAVTQLSDGPDGEQGGGQGVLFPSLDGTKLVFTGLNFDLIAPANGSSGAQVYIKNLVTGAITSATPNASDNSEFGAISQDGSKIVFVSNASLDPANQALNGDGPGYYTYEENLSDGVPHIRVFDSQTPDTLNPGSLIPAGDHLAQPLPVFPLAIADNGYDSEMVLTTNIDQSGTVDLFENFVLDGSVNASGQPTAPYNQLATFVPKVSSFPGTFQAYAPEFSADGSVVAFEGRFDAEQPTSVQPGPNTQIYAGSTASNHIALASSASDGTAMQFGAIDPALSADGKFLAFWSWDASGAPEVYVKNLTTGELKIASSDADGNAAVDNASGAFNAGFNSIAISTDGRYVAFTSDANLTPDDSGTGADLYVKDMQTGGIERVPLPAGTFANDLSTQLTMTADGQYIAFTTSAGLSAMDVNQTTDIYGVSLASIGTPAPTISLDPVGGDDKINAAEMSKNFLVSGTSDAIGGNVTLVIDGSTFSSGIVVGADGTWSTTIDATHLIDGQHQFRATVSNANGATASDGDLVTVDTVPPTVKFISAIPETQSTSDWSTIDILASFSEDIARFTPDVFFVTSGYYTVSVQPHFVDDGGPVIDSELDARFTSSDPSGHFHPFTVEIKPDTVFDDAGNRNGVEASETLGGVFDGYILGGTVGYDDGTGHINLNEPTATTDANGDFLLSGGTGPLVMTGGTDTSTGLAFTGTFETPDGGSALSPLTTLIEKVIEANPTDSVAQANDAVASALGLPVGTDLTSLDAVAGALAGDAASTAAFKAGSELLDVITLIQAAGGSPDAAYAALAADVAAGPIDLTDVTTIENIGQSAGLDAAVAQAVASIASATDVALEQQLAGATTPLQVFVDITGASIAAQGDASNALSHASGDAGYQQVADSYVQNLAATLSQDDLTAAENVACYCPGTLIATDRGDIAVEDLRIGDGVVVMSGLVRPIKWIGRRSYGGRFIIGRKDLLPICFKAGSLGDDVPKRDLWISPHHAMYLDGVLIEARDLVNGVSTVQAEAVDRVDYFHIELDSHDVIMAEGALSETFVDDDSRAMFYNAHEFFALYPDTARVAACYCAKRRADGYEVEAARRRIDARAGLRQAGGEAAAALRGYVDTVSAGRIVGWAQNPQYPEAPVCIDIYAGGRLIGQMLANCYRQDLLRAGLGSGLFKPL